MRVEIDVNGNITEHEDAPITPRTPEEIKQEHNLLMFSKIAELEAKQGRPLREAFSFDDVVREQAMKYIKQYDDEITVLRGQLL